MSNNTRPAASFDASYVTFSGDLKNPVKLPQDLVYLHVEDFVTIEVGGWGTNIRINIRPNAKINLIQNSDKNPFSYTLVLTPNNSKGSILSQEALNKQIANLIDVANKNQ